MLAGGKLIEGAARGFNPQARRQTLYPGRSNARGALHFGIDLPQPSDYISKTMLMWDEPPIHQDLVTFDRTGTPTVRPLSTAVS